MTIAAYVLFEPNTNSYYFGSSGDVDKRIQRHYQDLRNGTHHCAPLQDLWNQFGIIEPIIYPCSTRQEAYDWEQAFIDSNRDSANLLNIGLTVQGGDNLTRHPERESIIDRRNQAQRLRYDEMDALERKRVWGKVGVENPMYGKTHTVEARLKMAESASSEETVERLAGYKQTPAYRQALSAAASRRIGDKNAFHGKKHSDESRRKMGLANIGRVPTNAMSVCVNGVVYSSVREACAASGVSRPTFDKRLKSSYPGYSFVTKSPTTSESTERNETSDE